MADNASHDNNRVTTLLGVDKALFSLPTTIAVDPVTHELLVQSGSSSINGAFLNATSSAYESSRIIKGTPGRLYVVSGYNSKNAAQFIQLHDATSLPADTSVPVLPISIPAASNFSIDFGEKGRYFANGIVICNSSTGPTKTIGSADMWVDCQYL